MTEWRLRQQAEDGNMEFEKEKGPTKNTVKVFINYNCNLRCEKHFDLLRFKSKSNVRMDISDCKTEEEIQRLYQEKEKFEDDPVYLQGAINELRHYPQKIVADILLPHGIREMKKILESG